MSHFVQSTNIDPKYIFYNIISDKRVVRRTRNSSILAKIPKNKCYGTYKYRFNLQKGVKNRKYFFNSEKYNVSAF